MKKIFFIMIFILFIFSAKECTCSYDAKFSGGSVKLGLLEVDTYAK